MVGIGEISYYLCGEEMNIFVRLARLFRRDRRIGFIRSLSPDEQAASNKWWSQQSSTTDMTESEMLEAMRRLYEACNSDAGWEPVEKD